MKRFFLFLMLFSFIASPFANAAGWCEFEYYSVTTHGNKSDNVFLNGKLKDQTGGIWVTISDGNIGQANVSLALAAQLAGKKIAVYVDSANYTCANFPSWAPFGEIRHLRIQ